MTNQNCPSFCYTYYKETLMLEEEKGGYILFIQQTLLWECETQPYYAPISKVGGRGGAKGPLYIGVWGGGAGGCCSPPQLLGNSVFWAAAVLFWGRQWREGGVFQFSGGRMTSRGQCMTSRRQCPRGGCLWNPPLQEILYPRLLSV